MKQKFAQTSMSKKNIIPIAISLLLIIIGICCIYAGIYFKNKNISPENPLDKYELVETETTVTCNNAECTNPSKSLFANMSYESSSNTINDIINKINKETQECYELAIRKRNSSTICPNELAKYNTHSYQISNEYNSYTTDKVISISVHRSKIDLCTGEFTPYQVESYIYSIKDDKILTIEETKKLLNISSDDIQSAIQLNNEVFGDSLGVLISTQAHYNDIALYYDTIGDLYVSYYIPELNDYYPALLREHK